MGKVMRHTLGASLNIRHNLSSSKGPKPLQLKLLTTYIPKTSAFTLAFSTSQRLRTTREIKEMTRKVSAEVDLVHQQTQNQRYGSSHIGATAKDISNVVTDAASGVVDIFHGIDKAVADTWNNFWKDGKADGIG